MTPDQFIKKWKASTLTERAAAQSHFNDLCALLNEPSPTDADPKGEWYAFERGASKTAGGEGWADVWKRGHFAWENKGKRKDLRAAYAQLQQYAVALENPPLLVACDVETIEIHTNWTNTVHEVHRIGLEELREAAARAKLKAVFTDPERLKPGQTRQALTEKAAREFAGLALRLRTRGHDPQAVAHFVNRLVFCMFAEDVGLLPGRLFQRMLEHGAKRPEQFAVMAAQLFAAMRAGGLVGFEEVAWFNGGLFDNDMALPLEKEDIGQALAAARLDWAEIDPSILGTLFERGLDPDKRSQLGAHYTDRDKIMLIVGPVIVEPLTQKWEEQKEAIRSLLARADKARSPAVATKATNDARGLYTAFLERLRGFRVLDPACGSGNFLYLALLALKDIEHRVNLDAEALGFQRAFPTVGPEAVLGIEINPYAAELARVSVWIGEIQWMQRNGFSVSSNPILKPLRNIECRDAILKPDGTETEWPAADAIIGNPPFLGAKIMKGRLGVEATERIRATFGDRLPGFTDLVCYWFEKARAQILAGASQRAGLVATNSIAKNTNLPVLKRIQAGLVIHEAWRDEQWTVEGAAVRVALICFAPADKVAFPLRLDGQPVPGINANLTTGVDVTRATVLATNRGRSLLGIQKSGPFDVPGAVARAWMSLPMNPNGWHNNKVLKPYWNGDDVTGRPRDVWLIDLPRHLTAGEAAAFEAPFEHLRAIPYDPPGEMRALPAIRQQARDEHARYRWWEPYWPRPEMRQQIETLPRYIVTPETAEHRLFVWLSYPVLPDKNLIVFPRADYVFFGILHSRHHELWSTAQGNRMGQGNQRRYNNSVTFDTYPFPHGLGPDVPAAAHVENPRAEAIGAAARKLDMMRGRWLNPPELVRCEPEAAPGFPDRLLPMDAKAAAVLRQRTLTNLYNKRPAWLTNAHRELDEAVAAAYGWPADLANDEVLSRLLALNQARG